MRAFEGSVRIEDDRLLAWKIPAFDTFGAFLEVSRMVQVQDSI